MANVKHSLSVLDRRFAICRLEPGARVPDWAGAGDVWSVTRTPDELSVVCEAEGVPEAVECERDWRCLKVDGPLDFSLVGVLASIASALASARVSLFAISTFDTDYVLVRDSDLDAAIRTLRSAGHPVT
jgi:uncharacterized protein